MHAGAELPFGQGKAAARPYDFDNTRRYVCIYIHTISFVQILSVFSAAMLLSIENGLNGLSVLQCN
jgi:hypothetical protein